MRCPSAHASACPPAWLARAVRAATATALALALGASCQRTPTAARPAAGRVAAAAAVARPATSPTVPLAVPLPWPATATEPPAAESLGLVLARLRVATSAPGLPKLESMLTPGALEHLRDERGKLAMLPVTLAGQLAGPFDDVHLDGGRVALVSHHKGFDRTAWFYLRDGHWLWDAADTAAWHPADPGPRDPANHAVSLADAVSGLTGDGPLLATLQTDAGDIQCTLDEAGVPELVAQFVGLARGIRAWRLPDTPWQRKPFYDGLRLHRALPGVVVMTGDPVGQGRGDAGFHSPDVLRLHKRHDRAGVLSLVTLGQANTGSSQIALFVAPAPWADDLHQPFGLCTGISTLDWLSRQPPRSQVLRRVIISRGGPG